MFSQEKAKKILTKKGNNYSDQEVKSITLFLQLIVDLQMKELLNENCSNNGSRVKR
jgi:hypothetical protein